jgi:hypothetical protein
MLQAKDQVPFFEITTTDGRNLRYRDLWQQKNLLLVVMPDRSSASVAYLSRLNARMSELTVHDTVVAITSALIDGVPSPGVLIADRWGEIYYVAPTVDAPQMPEPDALIEWLRFVQYQCPECQGEAR